MDSMNKQMRELLKAIESTEQVAKVIDNLQQYVRHLSKYDRRKLEKGIYSGEFARLKPCLDNPNIFENTACLKRELVAGCASHIHALYACKTGPQSKHCEEETLTYFNCINNTVERLHVGVTLNYF